MVCPETHGSVLIFRMARTEGRKSPYGCVLEVSEVAPALSAAPVQRLAIASKGQPSLVCAVDPASYFCAPDLLCL